MLILTRRPVETINIRFPKGSYLVLPDGRRLTAEQLATDITVLGVKGNQVRMGVAVIKDVIVNRQEITERIEKESRGELAENHGNR